MRARNIKPGFFTNELLAEMPFETRLLFIGLWTLADREGRLEDRPKRIKGEIFPYEVFDIEPMLNRLQKDGFLVRYEVDSIHYIQIVNFVKHQDPHYKEKRSIIPAPEGERNLVLATQVAREQRRRILERDGNKCKQCGSTEYLCIDHIIPVSRGGDSSDENLQILCRGCNTAKGNKLAGEDKSLYRTRNDINLTSDQQKRSSPSDSLIPDSGFLIPDSITSTKPAPKNNNGAVFVPVVGGKEIELDPKFLAELEVAYPAVDVPATLREIRAWCLANPTKRKTASGIPRFVNTWLAKEQNRGA